MNVKLIRFEFRSTGRIMLGLYLALIILSLINRVTSEFGMMNTYELTLTSLSSVILMALYVICAGAMLLFTIVMVVIRFWRNLLENQGYLMHTLPVRTRDHIISKMLVAFVWLIVSFLVFLISIWILTWHNVDLTYIGHQFVSFLGEMFAVKGSVLFFILGLVIVIVSIFAELLKLYASMAIGQTFREHRILGSIGVYLIINIIESFFETGILMILGLAGHNVNSLNTWITESMFPIDEAGNLTSLYGAVLAEAIYLVIPVIYFVVYFFLTNHFLGKKLNLV